MRKETVMNRIKKLLKVGFRYHTGLSKRKMKCRKE